MMGWRRLVPDRASRGSAKRRALKNLRCLNDVTSGVARLVCLNSRGRFVSREAASNRARHLLWHAQHGFAFERVCADLVSTASRSSPRRRAFKGHRSEIDICVVHRRWDALNPVRQNGFHRPPRLDTSIPSPEHRVAIPFNQIHVVEHRNLRDSRDVGEAV